MQQSLILFSQVKKAIEHMANEEWVDVVSLSADILSGCSQKKKWTGNFGYCSYWALESALPFEVDLDVNGCR